MVAEVKAVEDAWLVSKQPTDGGELDDNEVGDTGLTVGVTNEVILLVAVEVDDGAELAGDVKTGTV